MWDNRETKKSPKQPDYKCKNRACDKAVWLEAKGGAKSGATASEGPGVNGARASRPLGPLYFNCMKVASSTVEALLGDKATPADVIAATATIFIAAANTGAPIMTPKPKPAPPPPPPKPEPEVEYGDNEEFDSQGLPF